MFEVLDQSTATCLAVHFSGKVTGEEYQQFLDALTERLKTGRQVGLVLELAGFEFYGDFETARKDFEFGFGDYKRIQSCGISRRSAMDRVVYPLDRPLHPSRGKALPRRPARSGFRLGMCVIRFKNGLSE